MEILILGYSSIVQRRVLPALLKQPQAGKIHLATRNGKVPSSLFDNQRFGEVYHDYKLALEKCPPGLCYISLPNSLHGVWAMEALRHGFHVVIDKPAVTNPTQATDLINLAKRHNLCVAEANVWMYHPLATKLQTCISEDGAPPQSVIALFTSPSLPLENFRYNPQLGAGAILDRGPYAVSCGRFLFGQTPIQIDCHIVTTTRDRSVDIAFSTTLVYPGGSILNGFFSLGSAYRNSLTIVGAKYAIEINRIFTPPSDYCGNVIATQGGHQKNYAVPAADSFANFFSDLFQNIADQTWDKFLEYLLQDSQVLAMMRRAASSRLLDQDS